MKHGKKYRTATALIDHKKLYTFEEAIPLLKQTNTTKFDATIDVSFNLNIDPKKADQQIRGTMVLPHGNGKTKRVLAITQKVEEAKNAEPTSSGAKTYSKKSKKKTGLTST
jgi:large subunit ribosomal protein L1